MVWFRHILLALAGGWLPTVEYFNQFTRMIYTWVRAHNLHTPHAGWGPGRDTRQTRTWLIEWTNEGSTRKNCNIQQYSIKTLVPSCWSVCLSVLPERFSLFSFFPTCYEPSTFSKGRRLIAQEERLAPSQVSKMLFSITSLYSTPEYSTVYYSNTI